MNHGCDWLHKRDTCSNEPKIRIDLMSRKLSDLNRPHQSLAGSGRVKGVKGVKG